MLLKYRNKIFVISVLLIIFSLWCFNVHAATTLTLLDGRLTITDSVGTGGESGGAVTITATGGTFTKTENTITITNESAVTATLSFDYTVSNADSHTLPAASGTYTALLAAGESCSFSITSKRWGGTVTLTMKNITLTEAAATSNVTFEYDSNSGSVTVGGTAVADGDTMPIELSGAQLVATPKTGKTFLGWIDEDGKILSNSASYSLKPTGDLTVKAVFIDPVSDVAWFLVNKTHLFNDLNAAGQASTTLTGEKTVVLMNNGVLSKNDGGYTIPSEVTLLIPFDDNHTLYTTKPSSESSYTEPTAYRTLTLAEGANIIINGSLSLSAKIRTGSASKESSCPTGKVSFVKMEKGSNITVNGNLYVYGFITGSGTITANSTAIVYECFQFMDYRGGSQSTAMKNNVFPMSQYYVQNVEVPMTLKKGAKEFCFMSVTVTLLGEQTAAVPFIGTSNCMFILQSGYIVKKYDGSKDRLIVDSYGDLSLSNLTLKVSIQEIDSSKYILPINGNITVHSHSGNISINQSLAMLPGSEIIIDEGVTCTLNSGYKVIVYDADQWSNYCSSTDKVFAPVAYAPGRTYDRKEADLVDAKVVVNGTIDASAGYIYTTSGGANICSDGTGVIITKAGTETTTYQYRQKDDTYDEITITPAKLKNADGGYVENSDTTNVLTFHYGNGIWCFEHVKLSVDDEGKMTCVGCGNQIEYTFDTDDKSLAINADANVLLANKQYYAIVEKGNNKYLIENADDSGAWYAIMPYITDIKGVNITFIRDDFANDLIRLRGYQTDGGAIRFFATIQESFDMWDSDGDEEYDIGFHEKYGGIRITMQVEGYEPLKHIQREVYSYLYNSDNGKSMEFIDSYVFSFRSNFTDLEGKILTISFAYVNQANPEEELTDTFTSSYTITFVNGEVVLVPYTAAA